MCYSEEIITIWTTTSSRVLLVEKIGHQEENILWCKDRNGTLYCKNKLIINLWDKILDQNKQFFDNKNVFIIHLFLTASVTEHGKKWPMSGFHQWVAHPKDGINGSYM